ncbi:MAG: hypothetical protein GQ474_08090 [Sulfurimonas sp.]|nr:hypothetical protein [Sulfurimonas sp.]
MKRVVSDYKSYIVTVDGVFDYPNTYNILFSLLQRNMNIINNDGFKDEEYRDVMDGYYDNE